MMPSYVDFITNKFIDKDVHIVASGPSLLGFDYSKLDGKTVITVNHTYKLVQHEFVVFVDVKFATREDPEVLEKTLCLSRKTRKLPPSVIGFTFCSIFSKDPRAGVYSRKNAGVAALCIALQGNAKHVYLWGFDCCFFTREQAREAARLNGVNPNIVTREFYGHSTSGIVNHEHDTQDDALLFEQRAELFNVFPRKLVTNCSPFSKIECFEKGNPFDN